MGDPLTGNLTRTEFCIYMLTVTRAKSGKSIAKILNKPVPTVKTHLYRIYTKMGVNSSLELLTQYWYRELHPQEQP